MIGIQELRRINREIGERAAERGDVPLHFDSQQTILEREWRLPNLGDHVPEGYEIVPDTAVMVDKSGFGGPGEPALTQDQFIKHLISRHERHPEHSWGVIEEGQFQVFVSEFRKVDS